MSAGVGASAEAASAAAIFARFAYPPNELGYCGPGDGHELLMVADRSRRTSDAARVSPGRGGLVDRSAPEPNLAEPDQLDMDMTGRARAFDGAWPYLLYLAGLSGVGSVMDPQVLEAYWLGNDLLEQTDSRSFSEAMTAAFAGQHGADWGALEARPGPVPHHSFHVFSVYPWVGVLRRTGAPRALQVLDRCRIRCGQVDAVDGDTVQVVGEPLSWDGTRLGLGPTEREPARFASGGRSLAGGLAVGDWVALHWDWVCDRLSTGQLDALRRYTVRQLAITNRGADPAAR
jgi:hypothetical protein